MCKKCNHKLGSTRHLLYWQAEWFKRFMLTWYHIINRRAYWNWMAEKYALQVWIKDIEDNTDNNGNYYGDRD